MTDSGTDDVQINHNTQHKRKILELEHQKAKERMSQQRESIKHLSNGGKRYLRLLFILIGLPAGILGIFEPSTLVGIFDFSTSDSCVFFNNNCISARSVSILVFISFLTSVISNILGSAYEDRGVKNITNPEDIQEVVESNRPITQHYKTRLQDYAERVHYNNKILHLLESALVVGKISFVFIIFGTALLGYVWVTETPVPIIRVIILSVTTFIGAVVIRYRMPDDYLSADRTINFDPTYSYDGEFCDDSREWKNEANAFKKEASNGETEEDDNE